nr:MAG TPA: hypothetical protein [Crassvirales sp.]
MWELLHLNKVLDHEFLDKLKEILYLLKFKI